MSRSLVRCGIGYGGWILIVAGLGLLAAGFVGARVATRQADQLSYLLSGGVGGLFVVGVGWAGVVVGGVERRRAEVAGLVANCS